MTRPRVLVCGDVINDILVETPAALVYGQDNPAAIQARPGGSAANQAAWMARFGLEVVFAGRAGAADVGFHRQQLARCGVEPWLAADESAATGSIVVLVGPDGERTMITDRGANLRLRPADVPAALLDRVDLLHLTGYSFFGAVPSKDAGPSKDTGPSEDTGPREVAIGLVAAARARRVPVTIDPGSAAFLAMLEPGAFLDWTRGAAVCFPNRDEAAVLAGPAVSAAVGGADPATMAAILARHYGAVALTLGADGAVLATGDAPPVRIPARPVAVRDTTGAGDAFCAGFLAAWLTGSDLAAAAASAAGAAALAVPVLGGRPANPE